MYTEEKPRKGRLLKEFIMRLILIIIFVLLLLWIIPWPNMAALNPLKDQIFNANLQTMKEAGISYFTTERLPKEVGDKTTLTLQKMLDLKLLVPFTDKNGKSCDVKKSYISLEKQETEYLMKVNLKCSEEEDYILVHLGCYSYCDSAICEAKKGNTEKPKTTPASSKTPSQTDKVVTRYTCKIVNGKYWGKSSTIVSKDTYEKECTVKPTPQYKCEIKDGVYWGINYTKVDKATYEKQCTTPVVQTYRCEIKDGNYWGANYSIVDKATYEKECTTPVVQTYKCEIKDGTYWGINYTVVDKATYEKECTTPVPSPVAKQFEYKKTVKTITAAKYSEWTDWTYYIKKTNDGVVYGKSATLEVEDAGTKYVKVGTTKEKKVTTTETRRELVQTDSKTYKACNNYSYVGDATTAYRIDSDWAYTGIVYRGYNPPDDTIDTRYISPEIDFAVCGDDCTNHPYFIYRQQKRTVTAFTNYSNLTVTCTDVVEKTIPVYSIKEVTINRTFIQKPQDVYANVRYYRVRTREMLEAAKTVTTSTTKWSVYNDTTLLNDGYNYTGNYK